MNNSGHDLPELGHVFDAVATTWGEGINLNYEHLDELSNRLIITERVYEDAINNYFRVIYN